MKDRNTIVTAILLLLAFSGFSSITQAVSPAPDGGYPGLTTAEGDKALFSLASGAANTAVGWFSLKSVTTGSFNTGVGAGALVLNTGDSNTATGTVALFLNTTGARNTANGTAALLFNSTGTDNTAVGFQALNSNTTGSFNTVNGVKALFSNTTSNGNTAIGFGALFHNNLGGGGNTAIGDNTLSGSTTGSGNTALGESAGASVLTANNVICIGANVVGADASDTTWIGNIYNTTTVSGTTLPVIVSDQGQLGTAPSSRRFKTEIRAMDKTSETILALKPVTFHYKGDVKGTPQFGLIAEEVAKLNPSLVVPDKEGKPFAVRYDAVNAMLLNEFLKEHKKTEKLEATVASLIATVKEQAAQIQKVSAQLEASKPAPQVVNNP